MFSLQHSYPGHREELKFSLAGSGAHFKGKTRGLAIKYVASGQENYLVDEKMLFVKAGQFIVLPEHLSYQTFTLKSPSPNRGICIDLNPEKFEDHLPGFQELDLLFGVVFSCKSFASLPEIIEGLQDHGEKTPFNYVYKELGEFSQDLQEISAAMGSSIKKTATRKEVLSKLFETKNFIHSHFTKKLSLDLLGKQAGLSPYHLNRLFRRCFGKTPLEIQVELKIQKALELLSGDASLSQIAFDLGYSDLAAFSNQFKKLRGESPSSYRKSL